MEQWRKLLNEIFFWASRFYRMANQIQIVAYVISFYGWFEGSGLREESEKNWGAERRNRNGDFGNRCQSLSNSLPHTLIVCDNALLLSISSLSIWIEETTCKSEIFFVYFFFILWYYALIIAFLIPIAGMHSQLTEIENHFNAFTIAYFQFNGRTFQ